MKKEISIEDSGLFTLAAELGLTIYAKDKKEDQPILIVAENPPEIPEKSPDQLT